MYLGNVLVGFIFVEKELVIICYGPKQSKDFKRKCFLLDKGYTQSDLMVVHVWHWNILF